MTNQTVLNEATTPVDNNQTVRPTEAASLTEEMNALEPKVEQAAAETQEAKQALHRGRKPDHYLLDPNNTDSNGVWQQKAAVWNNKQGYATVKFNDGGTYVMQSREARETLQAIRKQKAEQQTDPQRSQEKTQNPSMN